MPIVPLAEKPPTPIGVCATPYCREPAYVLSPYDQQPICYDCLEELEYLQNWKAKRQGKGTDQKKNEEQEGEG